MAALSFTTTDVVIISGNKQVKDIASGVTVTPGQVVTLDSSGNVVLASTASAELSGGGTVRADLFIALGGGSQGQSIALAPRGSVVDFGATGMQGEVYFLDGASGGIDDDHGALTTGEYVSILGYGTSDNYLNFEPNITGQTIP